MVHAKDLRKYWQIRGVQKILKSIFVRKQVVTKDSTPEPTMKCLRRFWRLVEKTWFNWVILLINLVNMVPVIMELYMTQNEEGKLSQEREDAFFYINVAFTIIYFIEFFVKVEYHESQLVEMVMGTIFGPLGSRISSVLLQKCLELH